MSRKRWPAESFPHTENKNIALVEAGAGIGKSLAYLASAIYWALHNREKTVISTHTISLQEQLITKDLPALISAMDAEISAVLVKGMGNCLLKKTARGEPEKKTPWRSRPRTFGY